MIAQGDGVSHRTGPGVETGASLGEALGESSMLTKVESIDERSKEACLASRPETSMLMGIADLAISGENGERLTSLGEDDGAVGDALRATSTP